MYRKCCSAIGRLGAQAESQRKKESLNLRRSTLFPVAGLVVSRSLAKLITDAYIECIYTAINNSCKLKRVQSKEQRRRNCEAMFRVKQQLHFLGKGTSRQQI